ncbi:hypothetical protein O181_026047 [Austropuccinia psidii MF-1]|uniref:Phenylalanine--tRNA ligase, mitochondrial n=1 Tax=Austropuccinia psidii MF-1 TaxID=1389203 RepID=A0A9Q3CPS6_9BASI|nr:hypothetical protein [Austropuccinia psidii MF-1]
MSVQLQNGCLEKLPLKCATRHDFGNPKGMSKTRSVSNYQFDSIYQPRCPTGKFSLHFIKSVVDGHPVAEGTGWPMDIGRYRLLRRLGFFIHRTYSNNLSSGQFAFVAAIKSVDMLSRMMMIKATSRLSCKTSKHHLIKCFHAEVASRLQSNQRPGGIDQHIVVGAESYPVDHMTNVPTSILQRLNQNLCDKTRHPLGILKDLISKNLPNFEIIRYPSAIVTPYQNFDQLGFPIDHPGRKKGDSYYLNSNFMLRTHTSAYEVETFSKGKEKWLLAADVYRRDEIDSSHFPIFHQMEGASVIDRSQINQFISNTNELQYRLSHQNLKIEDSTQVTADNPYQVEHDPYHATIVTKNLKATINSLIYELFGQLVNRNNSPLLIRWIPAYFPFTSPSYEVEVMYQGKWLEILGCGVVQQKTLNLANVPQKIGWAFGLGLERIAMILFSIPDIRLFWSADKRFLDQFEAGKVSCFQPFSKNPACYKDMSFWIPDGFELNDAYEVIREAGGNLIEEVKLLDVFKHPKTLQTSHCYRVTYRSMERNLSNEEVNHVQSLVCQALEAKLKLEFR